MALTKRQIEAIQAAIKAHYLSFAYEALGPRSLTEEELRELKRLGVLRDSVRHMVADPNALGKMVAILPLSTRTAVTYDMVMSAVRRMALPRTDVEEKAIEYATDHAGQYIRGIMDMTLRDVSAASARASGAALRAVRQGVAEAIANRQTISELKTTLFDMIDNRTRDWQRIAHTEINTAIQHGIHSEIISSSPAGADQVVFKRPAPTACKHCKRLYLKADGITPRVFKISELEETNVGLKSDQWNAVIGSTHPWCNCQLQIIPEGYDFVKMRVVIEPFEFDGEEYKRGEIIDDAIYAKLDKVSQSKIGYDAILTHVGKTAEVDVEKSMLPCFDDECFCGHD